MAEASPYRETCPGCKDLADKLENAQKWTTEWRTSYDKLKKEKEAHSCWSLGKETEGSTAMDILATAALIGSIATFALAAHGLTRWSVGMVLLVGAAFFRLWGISFRIW